MLGRSSWEINQQKDASWFGSQKCHFHLREAFLPPLSSPAAWSASFLLSSALSLLRPGHIRQPHGHQPWLLCVGSATALVRESKTTSALSALPSLTLPPPPSSTLLPKLVSKSTGIPLARLALLEMYNGNIPLLQACQLYAIRPSTPLQAVSL